MGVLIRPMTKAVMMTMMMTITYLKQGPTTESRLLHVPRRKEQGKATDQRTSQMMA